MIKRLTLIVGAAAFSTTAAASSVVATIPPLHSIVQAVMGNTGEAILLLQGQTSPHGVALKPSQVRALYDADVVFYIHREFETFLPETVQESGKAHSVVNFSGVNLLPYREEAGHHDDHDDHGEHEEHGKHDDHGEHEEHGKHDDHDEHSDHGEHDDHGHHHGEYDLHIWFDIDNVKAVTRQVARVLSARNPEYAETYANNSTVFQQRLDDLDDELTRALAPVMDAPYVVFHDAYQYAEKRYGLQAPTPLLAQPHLPPSARHLSAVKHAIESDDIRCAFSEPQFSDKPIRALAADGVLHLGVLDPMGANLQPGGDLYPALMRKFAQAIATCLSAQ